MQKEICSRGEIELMVNTFYGKVRTDELIGPIFNRVIGDRWDLHLEKMYSFWETILLDKHSYKGSPFPPHASLGLKEAHFNRWVSLFEETLEENFTGEIAEEARWRAKMMAALFKSKIEFLNRKNDPDGTR